LIRDEVSSILKDSIDEDVRMMAQRSKYELPDVPSGEAPARSNSRGVEELGREVIAAEIRGLQELRLSIGPEFKSAVELLLHCTGKIIVCGMGKSGIVARKIAATLSSTGTPAVYLHPAEAAHGDMGMIAKEDVFLAVSKSGKNDEMTKLFPYLKTMKVKMIAITATLGSPLAGESDVVMLTTAEKEACPMDIVPTTSTTAAMVLGDALAVAALQSRNFSKEDFARLHPSGVLGKRLNLTVGELMHRDDAVPLIGMDTRLREALFEIANKRLGCTGVSDGNGRLAGIITDGDLKRILIRNPGALEAKVSNLMTVPPRTTRAEVLAVDALEQMEMDPRGPVTQLFVTDEDGHPLGVIHIHDIIREGLR
jgi:arabinose-5-phosphate isomerase